MNYRTSSVGVSALIFLALGLTVTLFSAQPAKPGHGFRIQDFEIVLELSAGDGVTIIGGFKSVSGLDSETEIIEFREGGDEGVVRKIPGRTTYSNIVLKRGVIDAAQDDLWNWRKDIIDGVTDRRDGAVILLNKAGSEVLRYSFFEAFPSSWKGFDLDAAGNDTAVEEIELAVERIERMQ